MTGSGGLEPRLDGTWKIALIGGLASLPLTVWLYWRSGFGNHLSLNMVFVGGLLSGYLAYGTTATPESAGFRAGVIGATPGLWIVFQSLGVIANLGDPVWFTALATVLLSVGFPLLLFGFSGVVGLLGAKVGHWIAAKEIFRSVPNAVD